MADSKLENTINVLAQIDEAMANQDKNLANSLALNYINAQIAAKCSPADHAQFGALLLEGYVALNSRKKKIKLRTLDGIFDFYLKKLEETITEDKLEDRLPEDVSKDNFILAARDEYNEKKAEVLLYEIEKDLDKYDILLANTKGIEVSKLRRLSDEEKQNYEIKAVAQFKNKNLRDFIILYSLAGKNVFDYFKQNDPKGTELKNICDTYDNKVLDAIINKASNFTSLTRDSELAGKLYEHLMHDIEADKEAKQ